MFEEKTKKSKKPVATTKAKSLASKSKIQSKKKEKKKKEENLTEKQMLEKWRKKTATQKNKEFEEALEEDEKKIKLIEKEPIEIVTIVPSKITAKEKQEKIFEELGIEKSENVILPVTSKVIAKKNQDKIFEAIMAKMSTRNVSVETTEIEPEIKKYKKPLSERFPYPNVEQNVVSPKINLIDKFVKSFLFGTHIEIEASFGVFENSFFPGIKSHPDFVNLITFLEHNEIFNKKETEDVTENMPDNIRCHYTLENPSEKEFEIKIRDKDNFITFPEIGVRITASKEQTIPEYSVGKWRPILRRKRRRISFQTTKNNAFFGFIIELTVVEESVIEWVNNIENIKYTNTRYEVEIEIDNSLLKGKLSNIGEKFANIINYIYHGLVANLSTEQWEPIFYLSEREYIVKLHNNLFRFESEKWKNNDKYRLYDVTYWNKPKNITLGDLQPKKIKREEKKLEFSFGNSYPTVKLNGKRMFMLILNNTCWLIMPPFTVAKFGTVIDDKYDGTYLDGELEISKFKGVNPEIYNFSVFDILFYKGNDVRNKKFLNRLEIVKEILDEEIIEPFYGKVELKHFYTEGNIYKRIRDSITEYERKKQKDPESVDGLIIQPSGFYKNDDTFKWKPVNQLTIDFEFFPVTKEDIGNKEFPEIANENYNRAFFLNVKNKQDYEIFRPDEYKSYNGVLIFKPKDNYLKWSGAIVECLWDKKINNFTPIKLRDDRSYPNNYGTAMGVWKSIHEPVELSTIAGEDLVIMRKVHNKVKNFELEKYLKPDNIIIDIGSGRGGDLKKWRELKLNRIYAIEPNNKNSKELVKRLKEDQEKFGDEMPDVELLSFGAENTEKIKERIGADISKLNAIISFFSLTFFGEDAEKYNGLLETLDIIPEGGFFIGAVMDGKSVFNLINKERKDKSRSLKQINKDIEKLNEQISKIISGIDVKNESKISNIQQRISELGELSFKAKNNLSNTTKKSKIAELNEKLTEYEKESEQLKIKLNKIKEKYQYSVKNKDNLEKYEEKIKMLELEKEIFVPEKNIFISRRELKEKYEELSRLNKKDSEEIKLLNEKINLTTKPELKMPLIKRKEQLEQNLSDRTKITNRMQNILNDKETSPLEKEDIVTVKNSAFSIEQASFFDITRAYSDKDDEINEIEISINDPTSMVKDQKEWLFIFEIFEKKMNEMGFELLETDFIDGPNTKFLSSEAQEWSKLNRTFCFQRKKMQEYISVPKNVDDIQNIPNKFEENLIIKRVTTSSGGSFIHAILEAVDDKYRVLKSEEKIKYADNLRKSLGNNLTMETFQKLHDGELAKRMASSFFNKTSSKEDALEAAFIDFKLRLLNTKIELGDVSLLELLSDTLQVSIYMININKRYEISPFFYKSNKIYCEKLKAYDVAIVICKGEEQTEGRCVKSEEGFCESIYYTAGRMNSKDEYQFIFKQTDKFIENLYKESC
jgi:mRNA capping enzyme/mRNA capping enzyme, C-terminal domain